MVTGTRKVVERAKKTFQFRNGDFRITEWVGSVSVTSHEKAWRGDLKHSIDGNVIGYFKWRLTGPTNAHEKSE